MHSASTDMLDTGSMGLRRETFTNIQARTLALRLYACACSMSPEAEQGRRLSQAKFSARKKDRPSLIECYKCEPVASVFPSPVDTQLPSFSLPLPRGPTLTHICTKHKPTDLGLFKPTLDTALSVSYHSHYSHIRPCSIANISPYLSY